jgi:hypothetical protein
MECPGTTPYMQDGDKSQLLPFQRQQPDPQHQIKRSGMELGEAPGDTEGAGSGKRRATMRKFRS